MGPGKGEICVLIRKRRSGAESREKRGEGDDEGEGPEKPPTRELDDATIYESTIRATTRSREKPPTTTRVLSLNRPPQEPITSLRPRASVGIFLARPRSPMMFKLPEIPVVGLRCSHMSTQPKQPISYQPTSKKPLTNHQLQASYRAAPQTCPASSSREAIIASISAAVFVVKAPPRSRGKPAMCLGCGARSR